MPTLSRAPMYLTVALLGLSVACNKGEAPKTTSLSQGGAATPGGQLPSGHPDIAANPNPIPAASKVFLDSGNVAYRAKQFDAARKYYEKAAALAPDHGAPWFGIYMVGEATMNKKLADSALAEVKKRTPQDGSAMPGKVDSTMLNPHATPLPKS
ncbi:MAG: tetratricopeptide repeat protein [Gemmatimonadaceae bacterium]